MKDAKTSASIEVSKKLKKKSLSVRKPGREARGVSQRARGQAASGAGCRLKGVAAGSRPKRTIIPKNLDGATGLSWQEENELKRALYASLQESRRPSRQATPELLPDSLKPVQKQPVRESPSFSTTMSSTSATEKAPKKKKKRKKKFSPKVLRSRLVKTEKKKAKVASVPVEKPVTQHLNKHEQSLFKAKVHAQRKFAQNAVPFSAPSPSLTPVKMRASPNNEKKDITRGKKAKTEDFLTFLCLRGTDVLPPRLEFFNYPETPSTSRGSDSRPATPQSKVRLWKKASTSTSRETDLGVKPLPKETVTKPNKPRFKWRNASPVTPVERSMPPLSPSAVSLSQSNRIQPSRGAAMLRARKLAKKAKAIKSHKSATNVTDSRTMRKRKLCATVVLSDNTPVIKQTKLAVSVLHGKMKKISGEFLGRENSKSSGDVSDDIDYATESGLKRRLRSTVCHVDSGDGEISFKSPIINDVSGEGMFSADVVSSAPKSLKKRRRKGNSTRTVLSENVQSESMELPGSVSPSKKVRRSKVRKTATSPKVEREENVVKCCIPLPTFHPTIDEFHDPLVYIESIREQAEQFGMCKIVPPCGWKPECHVQEDMRFTSQVQYVHRMQHRWGSNVLETECIRRHLQGQGIKLEHPPVVAGVELDLAKCNEIIQEMGGMQKVIDKKKWVKVADALGLPVVAHDRSAKLYSAYCKYLLSYATLPPEEVTKIRNQVIAEREQNRNLFDGVCVSKGRSMSLANFFRAAEMTQAAWLKEQATPEDIEDQYWGYVNKCDCHVAVQCGHVDTAACGSAFPSKGAHSKHLWNYNVLSQHKSCVLRHLGPVKGVSSPTLHLGMLFSTSCWSCDPHLLPYMQYLHTGAPVVWYGVPKEDVTKFRTAMTILVPDVISKNPVWLPEDTAMVSPLSLAKYGVTVGRTVQKEGEFMVVFPETFTATVSCGYSISESLHIGTADWLCLGVQAAKMLQDSCEPELFSMDNLLWRLATSDSTPASTLQVVQPLLEKAILDELDHRAKLLSVGLKHSEQQTAEPESSLPSTRRKRTSLQLSTEEYVCEVTKKICYFSTVVQECDDSSKVVCYSPGVALVQLPKKQLKQCHLLYKFDEKDLLGVLDKLKMRLTAAESPRKRGKARKDV